MKDEILILADDRAGTASQAIGLARELGFEYRIINLSYSIFSLLPNFLFSSSLLRLKLNSQKEIKKINYTPRLVISAGRRSAPIALYIKNKLPKIKIIQIMNPNLDFKKFDFVILPKHDGISEKNFSNVITTIGALTKINDEQIILEQEKFASWFANINKPKIALLVGGSSKKTEFTEESAKKLAKIISKSYKNEMVLVLTSRRTDTNISKSLKQNLKCDFKFYDWNELKENPYLAILGYADFFIITGDSVSMISEACSTGKPVYIFDDKKISSKKHKKFHQELFAGNFAKKFNENFEVENFVPHKLEETKRVAFLIKKIIFS